MTDVQIQSPNLSRSRLPRVGFLGVGWIGLDRMRAVVESGCTEVVAIADQSPQMAAEARRLSPEASVVPPEAMIEMGLDGIVIATPSALHAEQSIAFLKEGIAVFCQKPLARTVAETRMVVTAASETDRLLAVDFSYRHTEGMTRIRDLVRSGALGRIYAVDLAFHNAYGPDKAWFYDRSLSGGGCVIDLGIHLVDLALWSLGFPRVTSVESALFAKGEAIRPGAREIEDYAVSTMTLASGAIVRIACSWGVSAGCDAIITAQFFGTEGGAVFRNVDGSFYDFIAERFRGKEREILARPPDAWGGRAVVDWATRLGRNKAYSRDVEELIKVAEVVDGIYAEESPAPTATTRTKQ